MFPKNITNLHERAELSGEDFDPDATLAHTAVAGLRSLLSAIVERGSFAQRTPIANSRWSGRA